MLGRGGDPAGGSPDAFKHVVAVGRLLAVEGQDIEGGAGSGDVVGVGIHGQVSPGWLCLWKKSPRTSASGVWSKVSSSKASVRIGR